MPDYYPNDPTGGRKRLRDIIASAFDPFAKLGVPSTADYSDFSGGIGGSYGSGIDPSNMMVFHAAGGGPGDKYQETVAVEKPKDQSFTPPGPRFDQNVPESFKTPSVAPEDSPDYQSLYEQRLANYQEPEPEKRGFWGRLARAAILGASNTPLTKETSEVINYTPESIHRRNEYRDSATRLAEAAKQQRAAEESAAKIETSKSLGGYYNRMGMPKQEALYDVPPQLRQILGGSTRASKEQIEVAQRMWSQGQAAAPKENVSLPTPEWMQEQGAPSTIGSENASAAAALYPRQPQGPQLKPGEIPESQQGHYLSAEDAIALHLPASYAGVWMPTAQAAQLAKPATTGVGPPSNFGGTTSQLDKNVGAALNNMMANLTSGEKLPDKLFAKYRAQDPDAMAAFAQENQQYMEQRQAIIDLNASNPGFNPVMVGPPTIYEKLGLPKPEEMPKHESWFGRWFSPPAAAPNNQPTQAPFPFRSNPPAAFTGSAASAPTTAAARPPAATTAPAAPATPSADLNEVITDSTGQRRKRYQQGPDGALYAWDDASDSYIEQ